MVDQYFVVDQSLGEKSSGFENIKYILLGAMIDIVPTVEPSSFLGIVVQNE